MDIDEPITESIVQDEGADDDWEEDQPYQPALASTSTLPPPFPSSTFASSTVQADKEWSTMREKYTNVRSSPKKNPRGVFEAFRSELSIHPRSFELTFPCPPSPLSLPFLSSSPSTRTVSAKVSPPVNSPLFNQDSTPATPSPPFLLVNSETSKVEHLPSWLFSSSHHHHHLNPPPPAPPLSPISPRPPPPTSPPLPQNESSSSKTPVPSSAI